jgi:hypothetical protein
LVFLVIFPDPRSSAKIRGKGFAFPIPAITAIPAIHKVLIQPNFSQGPYFFPACFQTESSYLYRKNSQGRPVSWRAGAGGAFVKVAMACAVLLALLAMPARAADERASSAGPVVTASAASTSSAVLPEPAAAPVNALPAAPSAMITPKKAPSTDHKFFSPANSLALGSLAAGLSADALSTQKGLAYPGFSEMNPLARPFVKSRAGAAIYSAGSFGLLATGMYVAHRTRHHKLERILPFAVAGWEGLLSFRNYQVIAQHTR